MTADRWEEVRVHEEGSEYPVRQECWEYPIGSRWRHWAHGTVEIVRHLAEGTDDHFGFAEVRRVRVVEIDELSITARKPGEDPTGPTFCVVIDDLKPPRLERPLTDTEIVDFLEAHLVRDFDIHAETRVGRSWPNYGPPTQTLREFVADVVAGSLEEDRRGPTRHAATRQRGANPLLGYAGR